MVTHSVKDLCAYIDSFIRGYQKEIMVNLCKMNKHSGQVMLNMIGQTSLAIEPMVTGLDSSDCAYLALAYGEYSLARERFNTCVNLKSWLEDFFSGKEVSLEDIKKFNPHWGGEALDKMKNNISADWFRIGK